MTFSTKRSVAAIGAAALLCALCVAPMLVQAAPQVCPDPSLCMTSTPSSDGSSLTLSIKTKIGSGWSAFGVGQSMSKADLVMIWRDTTGKWVASHRYSSGRTTPTTASQQRWQLRSGSTQPDSEGFYTVEVTRPVEASGANDMAVTSGASWIYAAMAADGVTAQRLPKHQDIFGSFTYNALSTEGGVAAVTGGGGVNANTRRTAVLAHAIVMTLAWSLISFGGIFVARFLKRRLPTTWFNIHRGLLTLALVLTLVGFGLVVGTTSADAHFSSFHGVLGLLVTMAAFAQLALGIVIDKMFDPKRKSVPARDKAHWLLGYALMLIAPVNVVIGHLIYGTALSMLVAIVVVLAVILLGFGFAQARIGQTHDHTEDPSGAAAAAAEENEMAHMKNPSRYASANRPFESGPPRPVRPYTAYQGSQQQQQQQHVQY